MCLYLRKKQRLPRIALTPKTVYKIVLANSTATEFTPFVFNEYEWFYKLGVKAKSKLNRYYRVVDEGLHSYTDLETAKYEYKSREYLKTEEYRIENPVIIECKIPRFSKYYRNSEQYASNKLIPIKVIENDKE